MTAGEHLVNAFKGGSADERMNEFVLAMDMMVLESSMSVAGCRDIVDYGRMSGRISVCNELAMAIAALRDAKGNANPEAEGGYPQEL